MSKPPLFSVANHHVDSCGTPPQIDESTPNRYLGYFENEHGEQTIFIYDRTTKKGTLYMGDALPGRSKPRRRPGDLPLGGPAAASASLDAASSSTRLSS